MNEDFFAEGLLPTTAVSDGLSGRGSMDASIKPLKSSDHVMGKALTVKLKKGQNAAFLKALEIAGPEHVLVVDTEEDTTYALAGDFVVGMAQTLGVRGIVTNGVIRDRLEIEELGLPVFCQGSTPNAGAKQEAGHVNVPISCGGVAVQPDDIVVADADGVVVIPQEEAETTIARAKEKLEKDEAREQKIAGNIEEIKTYLASF
ncbi:regulator of RNase E activity RraA [Salsuginibacillus halophilus]|uniref:Putative 4-hydroxy-4-methyl-2-oxoglutarate aldolase n=1 Tax=Salsuginibacillus halophilus TaxID=517424 RepID=A0A2P8H8T6_9BACI|nr:regulator [Salsuginibacillus halophilus]PSL42579.1 regulator of RNase E activity RraA [Salsuginibacillus halophilus]